LEKVDYNSDEGKKISRFYLHYIKSINYYIVEPE